MRKRTVVALGFLVVAASAYAQITDFFELVKTGTPQRVQDAIRKGANLEEGDKYGRSPLMWAAATNPNPEVITVLLKAGADIEARDKNRWTPLMFAAAGISESAGLLERRGVIFPLLCCSIRVRTSHRTA